MSTHPTTPTTGTATTTTTTTVAVYQPNQNETPPTTKFYPKPEADYQQISQNTQIFWEKLQAFHRSFGTKFKVPTIGGKALDLHRLFVEVTSRGGIENVIRDRKWKEITGVFNFPSTITSASFVLRKYYLSLLYHFEQVYYLGKKVLSTLADESVNKIVNGSAPLHALEDGAIVNKSSANPNLEPGSLVTGTIDAKFDSGYLITVNLGPEKLKGVLYHTPKAKALVPWGRENYQQENWTSMEQTQRG